MKDNWLNRYKGLPALACLLLLLVASGCAGGEGDTDGVPCPVAVDLQVGISDASKAPLTKAAATDALPGEQIHSLVVFVVNASGTVEKKFRPDLSGDEKAQEGELTGWSTGMFSLTDGTKQVYAFANWESLADGTLDNAIETPEGSPMPELPETVAWTNRSFDPGNGKYLPMSYSGTWTVSAGKKRIELVRLAGRLKVSVENETGHAITVNSLQVGPFNNSSYLFGRTDGILPTPTGGGWSITGIFENAALAGSSSGNAGEDAVNALESDWIYVNESEDPEGFEVALNTTSTGEGVTHGEGFHSGTKRTSFVKRIPRNHVWNLRLVFASFQLTLGIEGENPPIGGYPDVTTSRDGLTNLECTIRGGGPFKLTVKGLKSLETQAEYEVGGLEWSIARTDDADGLLVGGLAMDGTTITGRMVGAATATQAASFVLEVQNPETRRSLSFTVTLRFADIFQATGNN